MYKFTVFLVFLHLLVFDFGDAYCPTITPRSQWGAVPARLENSIGGNLPYVVIHHTDEAQCSNVAACKARVKSIQDYHMNGKAEKWNDIGYNFLVDQFGNIYSGRGWGIEGSHAKGYNRNSVGIAIIGKYRHMSPSASALAATQNLIACGVSTGQISSNYKLLGHKQIIQPSTGKDCPGNNLYSIIKQWPQWEPQP